MTLETLPNEQCAILRAATETVINKMLVDRRFAGLMRQMASACMGMMDAQERLEEEKSGFAQVNRSILDASQLVPKK